MFHRPIGEVEFEFKEIAAVDNEELDELTAIDVWKVPKFVTLRKLKQGHHVYIAKYKGRIVASHTLIMRDGSRTLNSCVNLKWLPMRPFT